ncbi:hypothetical protein [Streptomyces sp. LaPpAH-108]|uniref:hypothetical protein n=1 Tax=Streptomyces sp. LaPpAH-108 TaxID=1155714 RepID=UPI00037A30EB|nr:hypothetical protein [Streptomyces sp. LaPpAH-108]
MSRLSAELPALLLSLTLLGAFVGVVLPAVWSARADRRRDAARVLGQLLAGLGPVARRGVPLAPSHSSLYTEIMSDDIAAELFHPGDVVPTSGIYECDCDRAHEYSTDVKGHRFPPLRHDCGGHGWRLKAATPSGA